MGNTVSAAEIAAAQIVHPNDPIDELSPYKHHHHSFDRKNYSDEIPEECPMHKKKQPAASECPVQHDSKDINPLNMVCF